MAISVELEIERPEHIDAVREVHRSAFGGGSEARLVDRLRATDAFIPRLSLVACWGSLPVGHLLLTRGAVECQSGREAALALAPVAVRPEYQARGIGARLIHRALDDARSQGFNLVVVLGHPDYYPRFGFVPASRFGIVAPFDVPDEAWMARWLDASLARVLNGTMRYADPFHEL